MSYKQLKEKNKNILVKDLLKIIDLDLPEKYSYLSESGYKKISSKTSEVTNDDIYFLLEPYRYNNDKPISDYKRKKDAVKAYKKGAKFIISYMKLNKNIPHVVCENVRESHISVMSYLHSLNNIKTICITGSIGKTTTKDMLYSVLSKKFNTQASPLNNNMQIATGKIIQRLNPNCDIYIQEVGGGKPGGASRHSRMVNPIISLVTNVGTAHLGNFESQEDLRNHKLGIVDGMPKNGIFMKNLDDELIKNAKIEKYRNISYSVYNSEADYYASDIKYFGEYSEFIINKKVSNEKFKSKVNIPGVHNVLNAVACFAIGDFFGISSDKILEGIAEYRTSGIRQNLISIANRHFMVDCYNSSLASVVSSLESFYNLSNTDNSKKIVILGDATGLGEAEEDIHIEIGESIEKYKFDEVILYGKAIKAASDYLTKKGYSHKYYNFKNRKKLENYLCGLLNEGDFVLLKGSSKVNLEALVDFICGTKLYETRCISENECKFYTDKNFKYRFINNSGILYSYRGKKKSIKLPERVKRIKIVGLYNNAFINREKLNYFEFNKYCDYIGNNCFENCVNLQTVIFKSIRFIGVSAFNGCTSLNEVVLNNGVLHISQGAFENCINLTDVYIPDTVKQIDNNVFDNCKKLTIHCSENSVAYTYAKKNKIKIEVEN